jgi:hypothetical protein
MRLVSSLTLAAILLAPVIAAAESATLEVSVVHASKKEGAEDPRMGDLRGKLDDSGYRSFRLVSQEQVDAKQGEARSIALPGGRQLQATFKESNKGRAVLALGIPGVVNEANFKMSPGQSTNLGGRKLPHEDGVLFVSVKLVRVK